MDPIGNQTDNNSYDPDDRLTWTTTGSNESEPPVDTETGYDISSGVTQILVGKQPSPGATGATYCNTSTNGPTTGTDFE